MYLEISGEKVGKTSRLISAANRHVGIAVVVASSPDRASQLKRCGLKTEFITTANMLRKEQSTGEIPRPSSKVRFFFDDFDHYMDPPPILQGAYYATTPAKLRDKAKDPKDVLLQLVSKAGRNKVVNFRNSFVAQQLRQNDGATSKDAVYLLKALGAYIKPPAAKKKPVKRAAKVQPASA